MSRSFGLQPTLYSLGHGGASHNRATGARDLLEIQGRGQWRAASSLRRYEKSGRLSIELEKLAPAVLRRLQILEAEGPTSFEKRCERLLHSRGSA